jgi:hypothetical protein
MPNTDVTILTHSARVDFARFLKESDLFCAFGTGVPAWSNAPPVFTDNPNNPVIDLAVSELFRVRIFDKRYVVADPAGVLHLDTQNRYRPVDHPTDKLYLEAYIGATEQTTAPVIRQIGFFRGGTVLPELPQGQHLFLPSQVLTKGNLIGVRNLANNVATGQRQIVRQSGVVARIREVITI